jgi:hypothetical protein
MRSAAYARGVDPRADTLARLADVTLGVRRDQATRVAIDDFDAAADEPARVVAERGREVIRVSAFGAKP